MSDERRMNVLLEQMHRKADAVLEYVRDIPKLRKDVHELKGAANTTNERLTTVENVVRQHGRVLEKR